MDMDGDVWTWSEEDGKYKYTDPSDGITTVMRPGAFIFCEISGMIREVTDSETWNDIRANYYKAGDLGTPDPDYRLANRGMLAELDEIVGGKDIYRGRMRRLCTFIAIVMEKME